MTLNGKAKSVAPTIVSKYRKLKRPTRQPISPYKGAKSPEVSAARRALNNMVENYPYFTPTNKKRIIREIAKIIKNTR